MGCVEWPRHGCAGREEPVIRFVTHVSVAVYLVETGLLLAIAPWTMMWQRNYFADLLPDVAMAMEAGSVQGLVVAAGVMTALAGIKDLRAALNSRPRTILSAEGLESSGEPSSNTQS